MLRNTQGSYRATDKIACRIFTYAKHAIAPARIFGLEPNVLRIENGWHGGGKRYVMIHGKPYKPAAASAVTKAICDNAALTQHCPHFAEKLSFEAAMPPALPFTITG